MPSLRHPPRRQVRLLVVPGLRNSGPGHWQSWLERQQRGARRVVQDDWSTPDLNRWSARIETTLRAEPESLWLAVAHSFGCVALARHLVDDPDSPIVAAMMVAPASPARFGLEQAVPEAALPLPSVLVGSENDPWMSLEGARSLARRWGAHWVSLGLAGHINAESGHATLPLASAWVRAMRQQLAREQRPELADWREWSFAV
ncbi:alpha/beta hydrolase [Piscinibacter sp. Jin2]|uniref:Alpha/beta hydrolase n=1 Tax=Aquariibacter lacus TaxID=2801332 RepID=A0A9X1BRE6_9BURK|nr:alpha/beta hydrolase [Piscinibacter lacus]MBL0720646.1 alpha/beta hydrolase [Piscinibacter lacus]